VFLDVSYIAGLFQLISIIVSLIVLIVTNMVTVKKFIKKKDEEKQLREEEQNRKIDEILVNQTNCELCRIKSLIIDFSDKLRLKQQLDYLGENIYDININTFNIVLTEYDRYKKLGGNGYIDMEMEFIRKEYDVLRHK